MSKILSDVFQKSPSVFLSLRALGRSPPVPQLELGPRGARSGSGASARPSLSPSSRDAAHFPSRDLQQGPGVPLCGFRRRRPAPGGARGQGPGVEGSSAVAAGPRSGTARGRSVRGRAAEQPLPLSSNTARASGHPSAASTERVRRPRPLLCPSPCSPNRPGPPGTVGPSPSVGTRLPPRGTAMPSSGLGAGKRMLKAERPRLVIPLGPGHAPSADSPSPESRGLGCPTPLGQTPPAPRPGPGSAGQTTTCCHSGAS